MKFYKLFGMTMPSLNETTMENYVLRKELVKQVMKGEEILQANQHEIMHYLQSQYKVTLRKG